MFIEIVCVLDPEHPGSIWSMRVILFKYEYYPDQCPGVISLLIISKEFFDLFRMTVGTRKKCFEVHNILLAQTQVLMQRSFIE